MDTNRITSPIYQGLSLTPAEEAEIDQLIAQAEKLARAARIRRDARALDPYACNCGRDARGGPYPRVHAAACAYVQPRKGVRS